MVMKTNLKMFTMPPRGTFEGEKMSSRVRGGMAWGTFWTTSIQQSHPARLGAWSGGVPGKIFFRWSLWRGRQFVYGPLNRAPEPTSTQPSALRYCLGLQEKLENHLTWTKVIIQKEKSNASFEREQVLNTWLEFSRLHLCANTVISQLISMCFLRAYLSIYNVNVLRTKEILGCD